MPTINNLRGLLLEFSNGYSLGRTLLIKNDGVIPFTSFDLGASYAPINKLFTKSIGIGDHAGIATDGIGLLLTVDDIEYMLLRDNKITMKKPMDVLGQKIYGLPEPTADNEAATKKYVDDNAGSGLTKLEEDLTPKLGGSLDANGKSIYGGSMLGLQHLADVNNYCKIYHVPADGVAGLTEGWVLSSILNIYVNRLVSYLTIDNINNLSELTGKVLVTKEWVESKLPTGATNTFTSQDGKTVTVINGIITDIT